MHIQKFYKNFWSSWFKISESLMVFTETTRKCEQYFTSPARRFTVLLAAAKYLQKMYNSYENFLHICIKTCNKGRCRSTIASCVSRVPVIGSRLRVAVSGVYCRIFGENRWSSEKKVTLSPHLLSKQKTRRCSWEAQERDILYLFGTL